MEVLSAQVIKYYRTIGVASIRVNDVLEVGDSIHIKGHTTDFEQIVRSLQISHRVVTRVSAGEVAGLKVNDFVRKHDCVYSINKAGTRHRGSVTDCGTFPTATRKLRGD